MSHSQTPNAIALRARRKARIAAGLCTSCLRPVEEGKRQCAHHLKTGNKHKADYNKRNLEKGVCVSCGSPTVNGTRLCAYHNEQRVRIVRKYKKRKVEEGHCQGCGRKLPFESAVKNCPWCRDERRKNEWR